MPRLHSRRGFTLVELLIVMVLLSVVGAALVRSLTTAARVSDMQSQRSAMQGNLRAGSGLIPTELREINISASGSDLIGIGPDSVRYIAMRRLSLACSGVGTALVVRNTNSFGLTSFQAGDDLLIFREAADTSMADDSWVTRHVNSMATGTCPDGRAGTSFVLSAALPDSMKYDAPVRTYQTMTLKVYQSGGRWWLGMRSGTGSLEPVLGPLAASDTTFTFRDANGAITSTPANVRVIETWIRGQTEGQVSNGYDSRHYTQDSLRVRIRLRNAS